MRGIGHGSVVDFFLPDRPNGHLPSPASTHRRTHAMGSCLNTAAAAGREDAMPGIPNVKAGKRIS